MRTFKILTAAVAVLCGVSVLGWSEFKEESGKKTPWPCDVYPVDDGSFTAFCDVPEWLAWNDVPEDESSMRCFGYERIRVRTSVASSQPN